MATKSQLRKLFMAWDMALRMREVPKEHPEYEGLVWQANDDSDRAWRFAHDPPEEDLVFESECRQEVERWAQSLSFHEALRLGLLNKYGRKDS